MTKGTANNTDAVLVRLLKACHTPPPRLTVSEWAEQYRVVSSEETAAPGPWHNDRVPYTVEVMNAISDPSVRRVVCMFAAQMGKTSAAILNPIGYHIANDPCPIMVVQPTITMGETFSGKRLTPMLRDTPVLRDKVDTDNRRKSGQTVLEKSFPGGYIVIAGANSAPSLKSRPVRVLLFDEVDEAPENLSGQGDPVELAIARTDAFPNRKIVLTSTPTVKGKSRIEAAYQDSTQERWCHSCPSCGEWSQFSWRRLKFETLEMQCPHCKSYHTRAVWERGGGQWVKNNPGHETRGFHVNGLDSQMTWAELTDKWIEADRLAKAGNYSQLITFINTKLAETWEERGEAVESHSLESRREEYRAELPDGVCVLTMGVDVQHTRLAYEVVGWGIGFESWGIEYGELWGDPRQLQVWDGVDALLSRAWRYANGSGIKITRVAVDTGDGALTPLIYSYCKAREARGVYAIKGQGGDKLPLARPAKKARERGLFIVGVDGIKSDLYSWLKVQIPGDGFCHFPKQPDGQPACGYDGNFFSMLTAETRVAVKDKKGFAKYEWHLPSGKRNESLDTRVYARAALRIMWPREDVMLKRIHLTAPWNKPPDEAKPAQTPVNAGATGPKGTLRKPNNRNARARELGASY